MLSDFIAALTSHTHLGLFSHVRPDGDAIGSQIGCALFLEALGCKVHAFNGDDPGESISWLTAFYPIVAPSKALIEQCDAFVFLDGNAPNRFGDMGEYAASLGKPMYLIDHHPGVPEGLYTAQYAVISASSTAELVTDMYQLYDPTLLTREAALSLYTGMVTDTASFRFDSVRPEVLEKAAWLMRHGAFQAPEIYEKVYDNRTANQVRLLGMALESIQTHHNGQLGTIQITEKMLKETQTTYADTEGFVSYAMSMKGVVCGVLLCELDGKIKLSLRSKRLVNVNEWARTYGGGGHERASGAWLKSSLNEALHTIVTDAKSLLS